MVIFIPEEHKYVLQSDPNISFTSVSKVLESVKQPFDTDTIAASTAKKRGVTKEEILEEWRVIKEAALTKGTAYHEAFEAKLLEGKNVHPSNWTDGKKYAHNLVNLAPGVHPELILYNLKYGITGTADIVEIYEDKSFSLKDHKTSKKIEFQSFRKFDPIYKDRRPVMMRPPLQHLEDCNGYHYTLQLSLYAFFLEQFGYKCKELILHHVIFDENNEPCNVIDYPLEYLKKECHTLLNHFKNGRSKN
jgi:hypothetical protein